MFQHSNISPSDYAYVRAENQDEGATLGAWCEGGRRDVELRGVTSSPVARLAAVSMDCADPQRLADFYAALLGGRQLWARESSAGVEVSGGVLVLQRVDGYVPPVWPGTSIVHLDLTADDIDAAVDRAVALGAVLPEQPDPRWRVLLDPAGHPFCLTPFTPDTSG
jgi:hypothetical protein